MTPTNKILLGAILLVGGLTIWAASSKGATLQLPADDPTPPVVVVTPDTPDVPTLPPPTGYVVRIGDGPLQHCTGFYVGRNTVVTAGHCFKGMLGYGQDSKMDTVLTITADNGQDFTGYVSAWSSVEAGADDYLTLAFNAPKDWVPAVMDCQGKAEPIGTAVIAKGYPGIQELHYTETFGYVMGEQAPIFDFNRPEMMLQLPMAPGNSGGPIVDATTGLVVGIAGAINDFSNIYSYATPIQIVCDALHRDGVPNGSSPKLP